MKSIILSDIHSNLEAFEAVVKSLPENFQEIICAGDIVGYGADPADCIKLVKSLGIKSVLGNHDAKVSEKKGRFSFNESAMKAAEWTKDVLDSDEIYYLSSLPMVLDFSSFIAVHATLHHPDRYIYMTNIYEAMHTFELLDKKICFIGHSHKPCVFKYKNGNISEYFGDVIHLDDSAKYIINVGSVGQPRDLDNRACYCIYDDDKGFVEFFRIGYDIKKARRKIIDAGLPKRLGDRLVYGL